MNELEFAQERAAILASAVGVARVHLQRNRPSEALDALNVAAEKTHRLRFDQELERGYPVEAVEMLLGKRDWSAA